MQARQFVLARVPHEVGEGRQGRLVALAAEGELGRISGPAWPRLRRPSVAEAVAYRGVLGWRIRERDRARPGRDRDEPIAPGFGIGLSREARHRRRSERTGMRANAHRTSNAVCPLNTHHVSTWISRHGSQIWQIHSVKSRNTRCRYSPCYCAVLLPLDINQDSCYKYLPKTPKYMQTLVSNNWDVLFPCGRPLLDFSASFVILKRPPKSGTRLPPNICIYIYTSVCMYVRIYIDLETCACICRCRCRYSCRCDVEHRCRRIGICTCRWNM